MNPLSKRSLLFFSSLILSVSVCANDRPHRSHHDNPSPHVYQQKHKQHKNPVRIDIIDDEGLAFNKHKVRRQHRTRTHRAYLEAKKGRYYQLRVRNRSNKRVAVVIAVDGRNILTGKKSHLSSKERMYVLAPYQTAVYKGWRTGKNKINRFYFTTAGDSYSAAWGDYSAMGVIAAAVYNEKPIYRQPPAPYTYKEQSKGERAAKSNPSLKTEDAGTGFGREEYSASRQVRFRTQKKVAAKYFYKYEWRSSLCKRGVIECYKQPENRFWSDDYAPYPPRYYNK